MTPTMTLGGSVGGDDLGGHFDSNNGPTNNNQAPHRPRLDQGRPQRQRGRLGGTLMTEMIPLHPTPAVTDTDVAMAAAAEEEVETTNGQDDHDQSRSLFTF